MAGKNVPIIQVDDEKQNRQNQEFANQLNNILKIPILQGRLMQGVSVGTSAVQVEHKLGRVPNGWIIVGKTTAGNVYSSSPSTNLYLNLISSAQVSVDLWVF